MPTASVRSNVYISDWSRVWVDEGTLRITEDLERSGKKGDGAYMYTSRGADPFRHGGHNSMTSSIVMQEFSPHLR